MKKILKCDVCEIGSLSPDTDRYPATYKGRSDLIRRHFHRCNHCGGEYALEEDARENKREVIRFRKAIDSIPFGCEIRAMREAANLTQLDAGRIFGGGPTAFSKYETDDLVPNESMVNLLKLALQDLGIVARLLALKGVHVSVASSLKAGDFGGSERGWIPSDERQVSDVAVSTVVYQSGSFEAEQRWTH